MLVFFHGNFYIYMGARAWGTGIAIILQIKKKQQKQTQHTHTENPLQNLFSTCYMPGTVIKALHMLTHMISMTIS